MIWMRHRSFLTATFLGRGFEFAEINRRDGSQLRETTIGQSVLKEQCLKAEPPYGELRP
jgi:hypothetical protein